MNKKKAEDRKKQVTMYVKKKNKKALEQQIKDYAKGIEEEHDKKMAQA